MKKFNEAIDKSRRQEAGRLQEEGYEEILKNFRKFFGEKDFPFIRTLFGFIMDLEMKATFF